MATPLTRSALDAADARQRAQHTCPTRSTKLHATIDKWLGEGAEDVIAFLAGVVKGTETIPARAPGKNEDAVSVALIAQVEPTIRERIQAAELIMQYRHGMPKAHVEVSGTIEHSAAPAVDYGSLSDEELATLERITQKALPREVEGETITVQPAPKSTP